MRRLPARRQESLRPQDSASSPNVLARCDALDLGRFVRSRSAQLAYLDPPFRVGTSFGARAPGGGLRARGPVAYEDRWPSVDQYLSWLEARVAVVRESLAEDGTMWLHLDHRAVHEAKGVCDRVFGRGAHLGDVIWAVGNGARGVRRGPGITHQTLLVYAAGREFVWNARDPALREPFAPTSLAMHFAQVDESGRRYRERAIGSIWSDCPAMVANTPLRRESTGYPTKKPLRLLERVVRASTTPGRIVVDPFCGSGTTLVAAVKLGRSFIGCDIGEMAIEACSRRLDAEGVRFEVRVESGPWPTRRSFTPCS